jgi:hypothetical protein
MPEDAELKTLRSILESVAWAVGTTINANGGWDPRPGSQAASEIAEQGPFVARSKTPVLDAHSIALMRLASATEHFTALARLIEEPAFAYGPASLARTALENSARAWWALDPALNVGMRIARGRTDVIVNLKEIIRVLDAIHEIATDEERANNQDVRDKTTDTLSEIVADTEAIGLKVLRTKKGVPISVEESPLGSTAVIAAQLGPIGRIAYNDLSAVAHGTLFGMASRLEEAGRLSTMDGVQLAKPIVTMPSLRNLIAVTLRSYRQAMDRRMQLYGWDMTHWQAWKKESAKLLIPLLRRSGHDPEAEGG